MYFYTVEENYAKDGMRLDVGIASGVESACLDRSMAKNGKRFSVLVVWIALHGPKPYILFKEKHHTIWHPDNVGNMQTIRFWEKSVVRIQWLSHLSFVYMISCKHAIDHNWNNKALVTFSSQKVNDVNSHHLHRSKQKLGAFSST